jgi:hypothetical protein
MYTVLSQNIPDIYMKQKYMAQRFDLEYIKLNVVTCTVKLGYSNIGFCNTLSIASNIQWYKLIPHKATVFIPCLVQHAQMHQPRM